MYSYDDYSRVSGKTAQHVDTTDLNVLEETFTYRNPAEEGASSQVETYRTASPAGYDVTYSYTYDGNGNILTVSDGTNTTGYVYDTANQLLRENNQAAGKTWGYVYDDAGNILRRLEYAYTTGELGEPTDTVVYTYGDEEWGDLLTAYDGQTITHDAIGNPLTDGTWTYTWEHGRELASMTDGETTWDYTYNADGLRTKRTNGTTTYNYLYLNGQLVKETIGDTAMYFAYDADGKPMSVLYNDVTYYYVTNLQGDVVAVLSNTGELVVSYTYDAWGNLLTTTGSMAETLGAENPLRYRGYVYDAETGLYYLQSRYYDPGTGRFINADAFASTGQGLLGNNMFAYCENNPVNYFDNTGCIKRYIRDFDLYPNAQASEYFVLWYLNSNENETDASGNLTLNAKLKRTYNSLAYNMEFSAGIGQGFYGEFNLVDLGFAIGMYGNYATINYSDGTWYSGQEINTTASIAATQAFEVGFGNYEFLQKGRIVDSSSWFPLNNTQESWTIFSAACYTFVGGSIRLGFDLNTFLDDFSGIWG